MVQPEEIKTVAVIGTGFIGFGWAHLFCRAGLETRVYDSNSQAVEALCRRLPEELAFFRDEGIITDHEQEVAISRLKPCSDLATACAGANYIQECVPEDIQIKQHIFEELDRLSSPQAILASSVSALSITEITRNVHHAQRCVVAHPTNPPHLIPLVEVAGGASTSQETIATTYQFLEALGQKPIICRKEIFGYVLNRLQFALEQEAFYLLREGVATCADIDRCLTEGLGLRWALTGPFMVEELNAQNIADDLRKYGPSINEMIAALGSWHGPDEADIAVATAGVADILDGQSRQEVATKRARCILALRQLKERR